MTDNRTQTIEKVTLTVPSHPKYLYVIRSMLYPVMIDAGFTKRVTRRMILAVDEACSNIIKYAYEGDQSKTIGLTVIAEPERISIKLSDSGKRVERSQIAPRSLDEVRPGGLGTHFMAMVFDAMEYDTSGAAGTVLTLVKEKVR